MPEKMRCFAMFRRRLEGGLIVARRGWQKSEGRNALRPALAALSLLGTACAGSDLDLNPFYVGHVHETPQGTEARSISGGPFWEDEESPGLSDMAFHPIWRRIVTPDSVRIQALPPFYAERRTNDEVSHRFLALFFTRTYRSSATEPRHDFMLFPLLWWG